MSEDELRFLLRLTPKGKLAPLAVSFHEVKRASASGDEVLFLQLWHVDPRDAIHAPANERRAAVTLMGTKDLVRKEFSGQVVYLGEDPAHVASQYQYVWLRDGTIGMADAPDRRGIEDWLGLYFSVPVVRPGENDELVARLVRIPGFTYTNETNRDLTELIETSFPGGDRSIRQVFDRTHVFGTLVLIGPDTSLDGRRFRDELGSFFEAATGVRPGRNEPFRIGGLVVDRLSPGPDGAGVVMFAWWWPEVSIGGLLASQRPDITEPFLRAFFAAQPS